MNKSGAIFLYSPNNKSISGENNVVITLIGRIRNTHSIFNKNYIDWGAPPTLIDNITAKISINKNKQGHLFEIMPNGELGRELEGDSKDGTYTISNTNTAWFLLSYD